MSPGKFDFETRSAAGYVWNEDEGGWTGPPGAAESGLALVGVKNYVNHPTFKVLCMSFLLFDGLGVQLWVPGQPSPTRLLRYVSRGGLLAAWNVDFEYTVWNDFCVKAFNWPPLLLEQLVCDMATARAWTLPGKLANAGDVLNLDVLKDKDGARLIRKFTIPRDPTKKNDALWNEPTDPDPPPPKPKKEKRVVSDEEIRQYELRMQEWRDNGSIDDEIPF